MSIPARRARLAGKAVVRSLWIAAVASACFRSTPHVGDPAARDVGSERWIDSVLFSLSTRERAAQLVWPQVFGDYTAVGSPGWERVAALISAERVGGFVMSIGSPLETALKINAMQRLSSVPLLIGADYEAGAGYRSRGGYFLPNAIFLGGATTFPPQMALGATRDSALASAQGRITAIEARALGVYVAFAP